MNNVLGVPAYNLPSMMVLGSSPGRVPRPSILTNTSIDDDPVYVTNPENRISLRGGKKRSTTF